LELIFYLTCLREAAPAEAGAWNLVLISDMNEHNKYLLDRKTM
jgi:hypothetical protein